MPVGACDGLHWLMDPHDPVALTTRPDSGAISDPAATARTTTSPYLQAIRTHTPGALRLTTGAATVVAAGLTAAALAMGSRDCGNVHCSALLQWTRPHMLPISVVLASTAALTVLRLTSEHVDADAVRERSTDPAGMADDSAAATMHRRAITLLVAMSAIGGAPALATFALLSLGTMQARPLEWLWARSVGVTWTLTMARMAAEPRWRYRDGHRATT